ncbi:MAG TPA: cell surface protein, partial [Pirellulales bacterium]|nr:cell surface protein [Pirellulales bacterium]
MTNYGWIMRALAALLLALSAGAETARADAAIAKIEVFPPDVNLNTARDRQRFIVVATRTDGVTVDVTAQAQVALENPALVKLDDATLYPQADGATMLNVAFGGHAVKAPVTVKDATADRPISFKLDVMPVFMRAGCNTGSCHGAARGKDGFRLSLFGFDPAGDHYRLTRELAYRRINLALPAESLLLEKTDGTVPHTGGKRYERSSELYQTLLRWLEVGAPLDAGETPKVLAVELYPKQIVL